MQPRYIFHHTHSQDWAAFVFVYLGVKYDTKAVGPVRWRKPNNSRGSRKEIRTLRTLQPVLHHLTPSGSSHTSPNHTCSNANLKCLVSISASSPSFGQSCDSDDLRPALAFTRKRGRLLPPPVLLSARRSRTIIPPSGLRANASQFI